MKFVEWIKKNWKVTLIIILFILFVSKCTKSGNYERKYKKEVTKVEYIVDSMNSMHTKDIYIIDSLKHEIELANIRNSSLEKNNAQLEEVGKRKISVVFKQVSAENKKNN